MAKEIISTVTNQLAPIITYKKLSAQQMKLLVNNPIELIPAQGPQTVIVAKSCACRFGYGGTSAFTGPGYLTVKYNDPMSLVVFPSIMSNTSMTGTIDRYSISSYLQTSNMNLAPGTLANFGLILCNPVNDFGGNA